MNKLGNRVLIRASLTGRLPWQTEPQHIRGRFADNVRFRVQEIAVVPQREKNLSMELPSDCGTETLDLPGHTNLDGDFKTWTTLPGCFELEAGNETQEMQLFEASLIPEADRNNTDDLTSTSLLVPPDGVTFVSDIDDVLRVAEIWNWKQALLNVFARDWVPWLSMPDIYSKWSSEVRHSHFHYISETPEQDARFYVNGTNALYVQSHAVA